MTRRPGSRVLAALLLLLAATCARAACDAVQPVAAAERSIRGPQGERGPQPVTFPDRIPVDARSEHHRIRYRLDVSACAGSPAAALWLFRLGGPYAVHDQDGRPLPLLSAASDGLPFVDDGVGGKRAYNGRIPALFALPPGTRAVDVELLSIHYLPAGLVRPHLGPTNLLLPLQAAAHDAVISYADAASGIVLVLGALALLLWLQRRSDRALLWLSITCGLWGLRGVAYFSPVLALPPLAFELFNPFNVLLSSAALALSVLTLLGVLEPRVRRTLALATLAVSLVLALALAGALSAVLARGLAIATGFTMVLALPFVAWRRREVLRPWQLAVLMASVGVLLLCAAHDLLVMAAVLPPTASAYLFWGFVAMLVGFAAISGQYVVLTLNRAERSNEELERRVVRKTQELEQSYARLRESEREAARTQERERLLRDMHDGLGAQLVTALRGLERGSLGPHQLTRSLQDSLDELRLLMDSTDMGHYLPGALAAWRNRWDARLAAAGVALQWAIDESLDAVQLEGETALQVLRILQEAAANIVKHAQARHMAFDARVVAEAGGPVLRIGIADDGCGLPPQPARTGARGLGNMQQRAAQIGAELQVAPRVPEPGTAVVLRLPLPQPTSPRRAASMAASARDEIPSLR